MYSLKVGRCRGTRQPIVTFRLVIVEPEFKIKLEPEWELIISENW